MARTGGELIVDALVRAGVRHAFGIAGVHNLPIYDAIHDQDTLVSFATRHEQGAAYMADGYARASGHPGVALVTTGPGLTNTVTPLAGAWSDSVPLLVIGTAGELPLLGKYKGYLHEFKDQSAVMAAAAGTRLVTRVADLEQTTLEELARMQTGRPRPTALEVPIDVLGADRRRGPGAVAADSAAPATIRGVRRPHGRPAASRQVPATVRRRWRGPRGCQRPAAPARRASARPGAHHHQRQGRHFRYQPLVGWLYVAHLVRSNRRLPGPVASSRCRLGGRQPLDRHGHACLASALAAHARPPRPRRQRDGQELSGRRTPGRRRPARPGNAAGCPGRHR